jgi:hypothetical protein
MTHCFKKLADKTGIEPVLPVLQTGALPAELFVLSLLFRKGL